MIILKQHCRFISWCELRDDRIGLCLQSCVGGVCSALIAKEEQLNELDRGSGDGDCGSTLKAGVVGKEEKKKKNGETIKRF